MPIHEERQLLLFSHHACMNETQKIICFQSSCRSVPLSWSLKVPTFKTGELQICSYLPSYVIAFCDEHAVDFKMSFGNIDLFCGVGFTTTSNLKKNQFR